MNDAKTTATRLAGFMRPFRHAKAAFEATLLCCLAFALLAQERPSRGGVGPVANFSIVLGRPTDQSVTMSIVSATELEARLEYGVAEGIYTDKTGFRRLQTGVPLEFEVNSLKPDTKYHYRLATSVPGRSDIQSHSEGNFQTQRSPGSTFTFAVQGDSHPERRGKMFDPELYAQTMRNVTRDAPDLYVTMGDDFSIERLIELKLLTPAAVDQVYAYQRGFLGMVGNSSALFLVNGNHEQAALWNLDGTPNNPAFLAGRARTHFFPLPARDGFYSGDSRELEGVGLLRDYYSWTWGDALFVVIDFYWHSPVLVDNVPGGGNRQDGNSGSGRNRNLWQVTLGDAQYQWLTETLTQSRARWKFVFCHHVLGTGRGGVECAPFYEWGGRNRRGQTEFAQQRPGWALPIHQLMARNGVTIFFQGHDHLYARQELDGIVYQSCPNPADPTFQAFNSDAYTSGVKLPNSGYLRVTVSPERVHVDYVRSFLPKDETSQQRNGEVADRYNLKAPKQP